VNTTYAIQLGWKVVQAFLKPHTKKKISLTDKPFTKELYELAHESQVEEKYGGTAPDTEEFWPPIMPSENYDVDSDNIVSEEEYLEILKENKALRRRPDLILQDPVVENGVSLALFHQFTGFTIVEKQAILYEKSNVS